MRNLGWSVKRVRYDDDWSAVVAERPDVFGTGHP
jgi:hypothetical protein